MVARRLTPNYLTVNSWNAQMPASCRCHWFNELLMPFDACIGPTGKYGSIINVMKLSLLLFAWNCVIGDLAESKDVSPLVSRHGAKEMLPRHLQEGADNETATSQEFTFRRYLVNMRGASSDNMACPSPDPSVNIKCGGATLKLIDLDDSTFCTTDTADESINCTGSGQILVDCQATSFELMEFLSDLASLQVQVMTPSTAFSCNIPPNGFVGQGIFLGLVCNDNSVDYAQISCLPEEQLVVPDNSEPLCLERCFQQTCTCTNSDLQPFTTEIAAVPETCYWDLSMNSSPSMSPAPSTASSASVAPTNSF